MKEDNLCVHIVMDHYLFGIYELLINLLALIIHIVKEKFIDLEMFVLFFIARIAKDEAHKFGLISKVVWSSVKNSYVFQK